MERLSNVEQDVNTVWRVGQDTKANLVALDQVTKDNLEQIYETIGGINGDLDREIHDRLEENGTFKDQINALNLLMQQKTAAEQFQIQNVKTKMLLEKINDTQAKIRKENKDPLPPGELASLIKEIAMNSRIKSKATPQELSAWKAFMAGDILDRNPAWNKFLNTQFEETTDHLVDKYQYEAAGITTISQVENIKMGNYLMRTTGREYGPAIELETNKDKQVAANTTHNFTKNDEGIALSELINDNSSITEVLNILAFLTSPKTARKFNSKRSIKTGSHDNQGRFIDVPMDIITENGGNVNTWSASIDNVATALFELRTMSVHTNFPGAGVYIPQGILKRNLDNTQKPSLKLSEENVLPLVHACIVQLFNITENVRDVFSNWTKLSISTSGGGSKSETKKSRRNGRRRY